MYDYSGYGFFYFTCENDNKFELRFIPVENTKDQLMCFSPVLKFNTGLSFVCDVNDSGFIRKIRNYSKRECQIIMNGDYSVYYKTIAYYVPVYISYRIQDGINNTDSLKKIDETVFKNSRKSVVRLKLINTEKDLLKAINVDKIIFLDTTLSEARKKFGLSFNNIRKELSLPVLPANWEYEPSFTVGNTVMWVNNLNKNCSSSFLGAKSVAYSTNNCILSEQNVYSGPLINGKRQVLFESF
jgi:hypothetical protein